MRTPSTSRVALSKGIVLENGTSFPVAGSRSPSVPPMSKKTNSMADAAISRLHIHWLDESLGLTNCSGSGPKFDPRPSGQQNFTPRPRSHVVQLIGVQSSTCQIHHSPTGRSCATITLGSEPALPDSRQEVLRELATPLEWQACRHLEGRDLKAFPNLRRTFVVRPFEYSNSRRRSESWRRDQRPGVSASPNPPTWGLVAVCASKRTCL